MQTIIRTTRKLIVVLLVVAALFSAGFSPVTSAAALCSPTVSFNLWAKTGTVTLYGSTTTNIMGYAANSGAAPSLPGPVLDVPEGACVGVTLNNSLGETTALLFQGQNIIPDMTGVLPGGSFTYTFTANKPGTFVYEAGLLPGSQHQVAMGLYGALIVRPSTVGQAYASPSTAFDAESVLVLSEVDPVLNNSATPASFDMRNYAPKYFLINGKAYPATAPIIVLAGQKVLLRYINAGLQSHAMSLLGFSQTVVATGGNPFAYSHKMASETIAPGQTLDTIITAPTSVADGSKFAIYDANMMLRNSTGVTTNAGLGGMLTFLQVQGGSTGTLPDTTGPVLSSLTLNPNPSSGAVSVELAFLANDTATGNNNVTAAEYWIDGNLTHTSIPVGSPAASVALSATIASGLSTGTHIVSVRAQDALLNWSTTANINLVVDNVGPTTSALVLSPNPSSGAVSVVLSFNATDFATGNSNVTAAEYWVDSGAHVAVPVALPAPTKTLNISIPPGLSAGTHLVHARSQDAVGNWGPEAPTINLVVDNQGPAVGTVSASKNPNNGSMALSVSVQAVRVTASFSDVATGGANISVAEAFIDTPGVTGTGQFFIASDGIFNSPTESGFTDIPLVVIGALTPGNHPLCIHVKDSIGTWGPMNCSYLLRITPIISSITRVNATLTNASTVQFLVKFNTSVTGVTAANFAAVQSGLTGVSIASVTGSGQNWTVTVNTGTGNGLLGLNLVSALNIQDLVGNAMLSIGLPYAGPTYTIDKNGPTFTSFALNPTSIIQGVASVSLTVSGALDTGGSVVTGGEYWVNPPTSTTPAGGSGTQFSGSTTSISTGAFAPGTYTVSLRMRDGVGNWGSIQTNVLSVIPIAIFSDGFESPTTLPGNWTSRSTTTTTRLDNTTLAALIGLRGLQAQGNNTNYVQYDFGSLANPATGTFDARFYFNPHGNTGTNQDILVARTTGGVSVFRVRYRLNGVTPQVQIQVGTGNTNSTWTAITAAASNRIEVVWQSGGTLQLFVGGNLVASQTLTATTTLVGGVRMGSITSGGNATLEYFDGFSAKRSATPFGP